MANNSIQVDRGDWWAFQNLVRWPSSGMARLRQPALAQQQENPAGGDPAGVEGERYSNSGISSSADALNAVLPDRCRLHMSNLAGELREAAV